MGRCTMPGAFGIRRWLEDRFDDLFLAHDEAYVGKVPRRKADCILAGSMFVRGYPCIAVLVYIAVRVFGRLHYGGDNETP